MTDEELQEMLRLARARFGRLQRQAAFVPNYPDASPTSAQQQLIDDVRVDKYRQYWVVAANRCLAKGTLVATPAGPVAIESINVGDTVYSEQGNPILVKQVFANGKKEVADLHYRGKSWARCTKDHQWLVQDIRSKKLQECTAETLNGQLIIQQRVPGKGVTDLKGIGARWGRNRAIEETFDIHVDSPTNLYQLANGLVTHNSGKSATVFRILAWLLEESMPGWTRPTRWGTDSLLFVVCGRNGKQIEESILPYLEAALGEGEYKVVRIGNIVQRLEHKNGNRVVFQSMENANVARERMQAYTAHAVFIDEMAGSSSLISEAITRTYTTDGYFFASFTPLVYNLDIKAMVEGATEPVSKKYKFRMFDNPKINAEMQERILQDMSHLPEAERNARLFGDWVTPSTKVFDYSDDKMQRALPPNYSQGWRHVHSVDPAMSSKLGYVLAGEDPNTGIWYIVKALYISGIKDPNVLFNEVMKKSAGYNIVRRVCDPHETWFLGLAATKGAPHMTPYDKGSRRGEMISNVQQRLGISLFLVPGLSELRNELLGAQWSETTEGKIANSSKYHQLDSTIYLVDCLPATQPGTRPVEWWTEVRENDRRVRIAQAQSQVSKGASLGRVNRRNRQGRGTWTLR